MNKAGIMISDLYKSYVLKNLFQDVSKFVKRNLKDIEWDKEYWLNKAGLTEYRPARATFGGVSLFLLGIVAGGAAALAFAPKAGPELRADVAEKARDFLNKSNLKVEVEETARA